MKAAKALDRWVKDLTPERREYVMAQRKWARKVRLQRGDKVMVLALAENGQSGWCDVMKQPAQVGATYYVDWDGPDEIKPEWGISLFQSRENLEMARGPTAHVPFFVLVKI